MQVYCREWHNKKFVFSLSITVVLVVVWLMSKICNENSLIPRVSTYERKALKALYEFTYDQLSADCNIVHILIQQRNEASRTANELQQKIGQMQCQSLEKSKRSHTSQTGGWCQNAGKHFADENLAEELAELFKGKRVASFGDGPGKYKQLLEGAGKGITYDAYDGAPFSEETSEGGVKFLDLTLSQYGLPLYDWVISLEVAEHIPGEFESVYISNINRHAREGVVLSWAVPGQDGYAHINNRPFGYVVQVMKENGLHHDPEKSEILKTAAKLDWLKKNVNVFLRRNWTESESAMHLMT